MKKEEILNLFYNEIVMEASKGRIDCYFFYNIIFNTKIEDKFIEATSNVEDIIIPTLNIKDKDSFDDLLVIYVNRALKFYDDSNFQKDAIEEGINKEKIIMSLLWSNATWEDYNDPCNYLRKRINFLDSFMFKNLLDKRVLLGRSEILLDSDIICKIDVNKIESETPYSLNISLCKEDSNGLNIYRLPRIYFGIDNDVVYLYAIQQDKNKNLEKNSYQKKINRLMYKVDQGLDIYEETFDNYGVGNLKDVTPSFLVASNIALGLFRKMGYSKIMIPSFLITRWNSKRISNDFRKQRGIDSIELEQIEIQKNLTEKLLRTFLRLSYHHSGIENLNYVLEDSSYLSLYLSSKDKCNNLLLEETYYFENDLKRSR